MTSLESLAFIIAQICVLTRVNLSSYGVEEGVAKI